MKKLISFTLALVLVFSLAGCNNQQQDPYKSDHTVNALSTAIRTMSDSEYTDYDLVKFIYAHAFSYSKAATSVLPKDLAETLPTLFGGEADEVLVKVTVAFGGKQAAAVTVGELVATESLEQKQLYVGDLLLVNKGEENTYYIYDKDGLVNLSAPLEAVDTAAVLSVLPACDRFAVLRLTYNMEGRDLVAEKLPEQKLTEAQQAIVATAQSYLLRGDKLQYVSMANGLKSSHYIGERAPEDFTDDHYGPIQCSGFCYAVYRQALGTDIKYGDKKLITSDLMREHSAELGIQPYLLTCKKAAEYTEEEKEQITKELTDLLQPGDILLIDRVSGGHVMMYVGNGNIIHADGADYDTAKYIDIHEPTVRQMRFKDYFLTEGANGYIFGSDTGKKVKELCVVRPLDMFEGEIPEVTKNRMENLQGVMVQKLSSHNISWVADIGEEITYTFEIYNQNDNEITLTVSDVVPEKTEYVSGADTVNGDTLLWQVAVPANTRKMVSYVVKVAAEAQKGDVIVSESGIVGGVPVNCPGVTVGNTLSADELAKLKKAIEEYQPSKDKNGFEMVNDIYRLALGWGPVFEETDFDEVYEGKSGLYKQESEGVNSWIELRNDTKYGQMVAPQLSGGYGTKEGKKGMPVVMSPKNQQFVVGDILIADSFDGEGLYLYAGDGVIYDLLDGYKVDKRTAQGRTEFFLRTNQGYAVLRPSLVME